VELYIHFPFCRTKCAYCALTSHAGSTSSDRRDYVAARVREVEAFIAVYGLPSTVYFGGGSPALCDLSPLLPLLKGASEFTVELHPLDVTDAVLGVLVRGGVNRISMGIQAFDDAILASMGRGVDAATCEMAFRRVRSSVPNAGFDLIAGYPGVTDAAWKRTLERALALGPEHMSVYSLIREPGTRLDRYVREGRLSMPDDDAALGQIAAAERALSAAGLARYEISSWARPGRECRHNLAVWRGGDYRGLGDGAHGREGLLRTPSGERLDPERDQLERELFRWRLVEGVDLSEIPVRAPLLARRVDVWRKICVEMEEDGILENRGGLRWALSPRGTEVCDAFLERLISA